MCETTVYSPCFYASVSFSAIKVTEKTQFKITPLLAGIAAHSARRSYCCVHCSVVRLSVCLSVCLCVRHNGDLQNR